MGYGTTPNAVADVDLQSADIDAIITGIIGSGSPSGYGYAANLGDLLYMLEGLDNYGYYIDEYLNGNSSGPLTYCEENLYYIEQYLSDSASDGLIYQMQQDIAAMKAKLDNLTFDGDGALHITDALPV